MNTDSKYLNKVLANQTQEHIKNIIHLSWSRWLHSRDSEIIWQMKISKYNASHKQIQGQNHVIISVKVKKSFDRSQHCGRDINVWTISQVSQSNPERKEQCWRIITLDSRLRGRAIDTLVCGIEHPDKRPCSYKNGFWQRSQMYTL